MFTRMLVIGWILNHLYNPLDLHLSLDLDLPSRANPNPFVSVEAAPLEAKAFFASTLRPKEGSW